MKPLKEIKIAQYLILVGAMPVYIHPIEIDGTRRGRFICPGKNLFLSLTIENGNIKKKDKY
jgi:hypothetical protein